jgi:hypothetical protein
MNFDGSSAVFSWYVSFFSLSNHREESIFIFSPLKIDESFANWE